MESEFDYVLRQENILDRYEYLESIMKHYYLPYKKESLTMNDCLIDISRIITSLIGDSNSNDVIKVKKIFLILVKNSIRLDKNSISFKVLSYFIQQGFDLFVSILKEKKSTSFKKYISLLLNILKKKNIGEKLHLNNQEVENSLNLTQFIKVFDKMKLTNKMVCFVLLFFRKFVEEKDPIILEEIKQYITDKEIPNFYKMFDEEILKNKKTEEEKAEGTGFGKKKIEDEKAEGHGFENKTNEDEKIIEGNEKYEITDDFSNHLIQNTDDSSTLEKKKSGSQNLDSNDSSLNIINEFKPEENTIHAKNNSPVNNNDILNLIQNLTKEMENLKELSKKEIDDLKKKDEISKKEIDDLKKNDDLKNKRIEALDNEIIELKEKIKIFDKKLNLALLLNSLASQRDTYKKCLENLLEHLIVKHNLIITHNEGDPLWKKTKQVCDKILELNEKKEDENNIKLVNGLISLLFCKDYVNCLVHGKGKLSGQIKKLSQKKDEIPFISISSYENMKDATLKFFGTTINEFEEFKFIISLLKEKIKKWNDPKDFDYSRYFTPNGIKNDVLIEDFNIIVDIMDKLNISENVDMALEN